ncbi:MAG: glycosyltransferase [Candidatus Peribacteraceae bacterium]|nr:glycosyltransferase [Candidatus Peribacteraceae bacterium]
MKVALVHELLTMRGGAERVLKIAADLFPEAPIYTLLYDEKKLGDWFPANRVRPSSLQRFAGISTNHHLYLKHFPAAVEAWDFSQFDLVISFSSAFAHGIICNGRPKHICYVHSPARYLWDRTHDVLSTADHGLFGSLKRRHLEKIFHTLRIWDSEAADRPDKLLAASKEVQRRIELYWRRESDVVYPPIDDSWLDNTKYELRSTNYEKSFLIVSTLARYKRIDLAIQACNELNLPLTIVGDGPDKNRLKSIAGPTVRLRGHLAHAAVRELYKSATATIFPGEEDFGLVPLESMACGTPVIAYGKGGALETVIAGKTGTFFDEPTVESLKKVLMDFDATRFDPSDCRKQAEKFNRTQFEAQLRKAIEEL